MWRFYVTNPINHFVTWIMWTPVTSGWRTW